MSYVRIAFSPNFTAGMYFDSGIIMNTFSLDIQMMTKTNSHYNQNIAMERAKYIIYEQFCDAIILGADDEKHRKKYEDAGFRIIILPAECADQIICLALYCKLQAVVEDNMDILDVSLRSTIGGGVSYLHSDEESIGPFETKGWWSESTPLCSKTKATKKKIVSLNSPTWKSVDLEWDNGNTIEEEIIIEVKLDKSTKKVDITGENIVELRPNDKK